MIHPSFDHVRFILFLIRILVPGRLMDDSEQCRYSLSLMLLRYHCQKLSELAVEPFKGGRLGWLVIGMCEFLNGKIFEVIADDLLG